MTANPQAPLHYRTGAGVIAVGVFFLMLGLGLGGGMIMLALIGDAATPLWLRIALLAGAAFPLAVAALGFLLTLGGERIKLDPVARTVHVAHGRWWTWKRRVLPFEAFYAVELYHSATADALRGHQVGGCPIRLVGTDNELQLADIGSTPRARQVARQIATVTGLPLHDATDGRTTIRRPEEFGESLATRARRLGAATRWPRLPADGRIDVRRWGEETVIDLPRPGGRKSAEGALSLLFLLVLYGGVMLGIGAGLRHTLGSLGIATDTGLVPVLIWGIPLIPVLWILGFGLILLLARERITVSPRMLRRVWRLPVGRWTVRVPTGAIEELRLARDDVIVRTATTSFRFGFALDRRERRWLHDALRHLLVTGADEQLAPLPADETR